MHIPKKAISVRDAIMSDSESLPIKECIGKIASAVTLGCPPAIPIIVPGEVIDESTVSVFEYYGIKSCSIIK